ncbi:MAG: hypothetical protein ACE5K4_00750 [Candidatus Hydrothermarchaeota archaeon]
MKKKVIIEIEESPGEKETITIQGDNLWGKLLKYKHLLVDTPEQLDFSDDLKSEGYDLTSIDKPYWLPSEKKLKNMSRKEKLFLLLREMHPNEWVKSQQLKREYINIFEEDLPLSSVSTYLARLHKDGFVERRGSRAQREYRLVSEAISP